ncbi:MAG: DUF6587 family protein [Thermomonas sp.]
MGTSLLVQYVVIALAVVGSVVVVMRKQFPHATRRLRIAIALPMLRGASPGVLKKVGRWIAPVPVSGGKDCGGCDSCD